MRRPSCSVAAKRPLAHALARPQRQLAAGRLVASQRPGDLRVRLVKDIVQQEGGAFGRRQPLQRQHQRHRQIVRQRALAQPAVQAGVGSGSGSHGPTYSRARGPI